MTKRQRIIFWTIVGIVLQSIMTLTYGNAIHSFFLITMLLPIIGVVSLVFNYVLVPRYYESGRYLYFILYVVYTIIIAMYLELLVITIGFVVLANYNPGNSIPVSSDVFILAGCLFLIVFIEGFILAQAKLKESARRMAFLNRQTQAAKKPSISVTSNRRQQTIVYDQLIYVESMGDYLKLHVKDRAPIVTKEKISHLAQRLPPSFIRIHRSFIVNRNWISSYSKAQIQIDSLELPISRSYKNVVWEALNSLSDEPS